MNVLVVNSGSLSVKFQLLQMPREKVTGFPVAVVVVTAHEELEIARQVAFSDCFSKSNGINLCTIRSERLNKNMLYTEKCYQIVAMFVLN